MPRNAWLTPDDPGAGFICRPLFIPNGLDWLAIVTGALNELVYNYNFEEYGTTSVADTVAAFQTMFDHFCFDDETGCRMIGEIILFAADTSPSPNWLACDGASLLRADYPDLFAVIGTAFGSADGSHFSVPDLRGRAMVGVGTGASLTPRALGDNFGEETHTLITAEIPSHTHLDTGHTHVEGIAVPAVGAAIVGVPIPSAVPGVGATGVGTAALSSVGGDGAHNNLQPSIALNFFIVAED